MRIGNRLFPYPVLNRDSELSDYPEGTYFSLLFDLDETGSPRVEGEELVLPNIRYGIGCPPIEKLLELRLASGALVVECSASMYRRCFAISSQPRQIRIPINELNGEVSISCYLKADGDIIGFGGEGFSEVYRNISFDIEKNDILAVDDGLTFRIGHDASSDNRVSSIFKIVRLEQEDTNRTTYESTDTGIIIELPAKYYDSYSKIKMRSDYNNIAFAMIAIPALTGCLFDVQNEVQAGNYSEIDDIVEGRRWFNSVRFSYKKATGQELSIDILNMSNPYELAQTVLNDASCKGLADFSELLLGSGSDDAEDSGVDNE